MSFNAGDIVSLKLPGGGGHGDPAKREASRTQSDLDAGYVTPAGALEDYGHEPT